MVSEEEKQRQQELKARLKAAQEARKQTAPFRPLEKLASAEQRIQQEAPKTAKPESEAPTSSMNDGRKTFNGNLSKIFDRKESSSPSKESKTPNQAASMGWYFFLLFLSIVVFITKYYVEYNPTTSLLISIILGIFFLIVVYKTPEPGVKELLVILVLALDIGFAQGALYFLPENVLRSILLKIHVFSWIILAVVLFLWGMADASAAGKKLPKTAWLVLACVVGIALFFVFPLILEQPLLYQDKTQKEYYEQARKEITKAGQTFAETKNKWSDYFSCTFDQVTDPQQDREQCLKKARVERYCLTQSPEQQDQQRCVQEQLAGRIAVSGINDPTIKQPTTAEFAVDRFFPATIYHNKGDQTAQSYPLTLKIANPRKQGITVDLQCSFRHLGDGIVIPGRIVDPATLQVALESYSTTVLCEAPPDTLDGKYNVVYNAALRNLNTVSRLQRAFIGPKSPEQKKTLVADILNAHFPGRNYLSQGPADFVHFNFALGNPVENPIIENQKVLLSSTIENAGTGRIIHISYYALNLPGFTPEGISSQENGDCLEGFNLPVPTSYKQIIYLPNCYLNLPAELENPAEYVFTEFSGRVDYDYQIFKEVPIEIIVTGKSQAEAPRAG